MKKITKFLPFVMAVMLTAPAFAEAPTPAPVNATTDQSITVAPFINITHEASTETATASFNAGYTTLNLDAGMTTVFKVVTNNPDDCVILTGTALAESEQVNAIYGNDEDNLNLVFTNNGTGAREAKKTAVTNITGGTGVDKALNANAIAFTLGAVCSPDAASGAAAPTVAKLANGLKYPIQNGVYTFTYTTGTAALANTFSTHDTDGTYKATLTLTQTTR